jgi:hypothetical protein
MSLYYVSLLSAFSIVVPFTAAISRIKTLGRKYRPMVILLTVGLFNEIVSSIGAQLFKNNALNGNIYVLIEYLLIIWQFQRLNGDLSRTFKITIISIGVGIWITDNFILHTLAQNNSIFRMLSSLCVVYLSMDKANQLLFFNGPLLSKNTDLLICCGFFSYFLLKTYVEVFNVFTMPVKWTFYENLWGILAIINLLTNILLTLAIICFRQKQESTIHFSRD